MPNLHLRPVAVPAEIAQGLADLRASLEIPSEFPPPVVAAAQAVVEHPRPLPDLDRTDLELVTIDPPGSMDLDQAVHVAKNGTGYTVHYAIADVAAWVSPGDPIDVEAHRRGQTVYAPDRRESLHPPVLSEGAASLLADGHARPALLWTIELDSDGAQISARVERAAVRSRAQLTYEEVQDQLDQGTATDSLHLLEIVGRLRQQQEIERGGVSLDIPDQEIEADGDQWKLVFRAPRPIDGWNAQISLLTGAAAAQMMIDGKVGLLRTLPPAEQRNVDWLRRIAKGLKIAWPGSMSYPEFVRSLDPSVPTHLAMITSSTLLFRGAGYTPFDGALPAGNLEHGALAMPYAHVTAPLRRLVDRYGGEVCVALCAGQPVPVWVTRELAGLPALMAASDQRAKKYERGIVDLLEALVLEPHVGETFTGTVVELEKDGQSGQVYLAEPAVMAKVLGPVELGQEVSVALDTADPRTGKVVFKAH